MPTQSRPALAVALASLLFLITPRAQAGVVLPADRPAADLSWAPFPLSGTQVRNNAAPGAPADGSATSNATGSATFAYDRDTDHLSYTVSWQDLAGPLVGIRVYGPATASQSYDLDDRLFDVLSDGVAVTNAGVGRTTGSYSGTLDLQNPPVIDCGCGDVDLAAAGKELAAKILDSLVQGRAYVNVATQAYPTGELRGNFPAADVAGEPSPGPTPVPLPPAAWPALATAAGFIVLRVVRK